MQPVFNCSLCLQRNLRERPLAAADIVGSSVFGIALLLLPLPAGAALLEVARVDFYPQKDAQCTCLLTQTGSGPSDRQKTRTLVPGEHRDASRGFFSSNKV